MPTIMSVTNSRGSRRCDASCHRARKPACRCICNGRYHGRGDEGAQARLTKDYLGENWKAIRDELGPGKFESVVLGAIEDAAATVGERMQADLFR